MSLLNWLEQEYRLLPLQKLVFDSLLLPDAEAAPAFTDWMDSVNFDALDYSSFRLVPALFRRHAEGHPELPHYARMKGIYRYFYFRNSLLLAETHAMVAMLQSSGIPVICFKGLAIALKYYSQPALRPMGDIDILVPRDCFVRADALLQEQGWQHRYSEDHLRDAPHSRDFVSKSGNGIDLHRHALLEVDNEAFENDLRARTEAFEWNDLGVRFMSAEDLVLTSLVNGVREPDRMKLEWIYDLDHILTATPSFDWTTFWRTSSNYGLMETAFHALHFASAFVRVTNLAATLDTWLAQSPEFEQRLLDDATAEGRTYGLTPEKQLKVALPSAQPAFGRFFGFFRKKADHPRGGPLHRVQYIRIFTDPDGALEALYLHARHLPYIAELFCVSDPAILANLIRGVPAAGEGLLNLPKELLSLPKSLECTPRIYRAQIDLCAPQLPIVLQAGERIVFHFRVRNTSSFCWPEYGSVPARFNLLLKILDADRTPLAWDEQRACLMKPRENSVAFMAPGVEVPVSMVFVAPLIPGSYLLRLDILWEQVCWYSHQGMLPQEIEITVKG